MLVSMGIFELTVDGQRYVALPSHAEQSEPWAKYHASVVNAQRLTVVRLQKVRLIEGLPCLRIWMLNLPRNFLTLAISVSSL